MHSVYREDETFTREDYGSEPLPKGEYDSCTFVHCNLAHADLAAIAFLDCTFVNCNLSLATLAGTTLRDIVFRDCKMLGLRFDTCNAIGLAASFDTCILDHSSWCSTRIPQTVFRNTRLREVDFTDCNASGSVFEHCDLLGAVFARTNLEGADFRTSFHYSIDPATNRLGKARFSLQGLPGLVDRYGIIIDG